MRLKLQRQPINDTNMTFPRYRNVHTPINITTISPSAYKMTTIQREYTWKEVKEDIKLHQSYFNSKLVIPSMTYLTLFFVI